ncbi:MAG TPA: glycoside hydrolase family 88 protein [Acidobacteriota bacterium]|nr:glycoside hydrolase family 88 protein [Acidobacteriota bacterium]
MVHCRNRILLAASGLLVIRCCLFLTAAGRASHGNRAAEPDRAPWSERMATSEMNRRGKSLVYSRESQARWNYETGVFLKGLEAVWQKTGDERYYQYLKSIVDSYLGSDGSIATYNLADYNLDSINSGKILLTLHEKTKDESYRLAADRLMGQLEKQPRTPEGGFWHKKIYPNQMWLDGIYMAAPFFAQYSRTFHIPAGFDDILRQVTLVGVHTHDPDTGLLFHAWDAAKTQPWANPQTGCSKSFWARSIGWYVMALVDILDYFPADHPGRRQIVDRFGSTLAAIRRYQDPESGLWYQVVDQGTRPGNYLEASASCMFVYAMAKGSREGLVGAEYLEFAEAGYRGILRHFVRVDSTGLISLSCICSSAGLGGPKQRNGTFEYYISEPVVTNDLKGVGAFILASVEMERRNGGQ